MREEHNAFIEVKSMQISVKSNIKLDDKLNLINMSEYGSCNLVLVLVFDVVVSSVSKYGEKLAREHVVPATEKNEKIKKKPEHQSSWQNKQTNRWCNYCLSIADLPNRMNGTWKMNKM